MDRNLFLRRDRKTEIFYSRSAIIIGNGDTSAVQFTDRHFRSGLRQAHGRFQAILKYLLDHVGHTLAAVVVKQCFALVRRIGNDHDMPAFPLQMIDSSKLFPIVQEKKIIPNDRASSICPHAVRGEVHGVLNKLAHWILQIDR